MFPQFDPSKMDPKVLMELSALIQQLPPQMMNQMQSIMHNSMAGFDVKNQMEEFEKNLPPGFREKLMSLMAGQMGAFGGTSPMTDARPQTSEIETETSASSTTTNMDMREARLTVLRAVAENRLNPEEAEKLLFP